MKGRPECVPLDEIAVEVARRKTAGFFRWGKIAQKKRSKD